MATSVDPSQNHDVRALSESARVSAAEEPRVLMVSRDDALLHLAEGLIAAGYSVRVAGHHGLAQDIAQAFAPNILILDQRLALEDRVRVPGAACTNILIAD